MLFFIYIYTHRYINKYNEDHVITSVILMVAWFKVPWFFVSDLILSAITEISSAKTAQCDCCSVRNAAQFAVLCWDLVIGVSRRYTLSSRSLRLFRTSLWNKSVFLGCCSNDVSQTHWLISKCGLLRSKTSTLISIVLILSRLCYNKWCGIYWIRAERQK